METHKSARVKSFIKALEQGAPHPPVRLMLNSLHPAEIAHLIESVPLTHREILWELVNSESGGEVLLHVNDEVRASLIEKMETTEIVAATENMDMDDLADFIKDLPTTVSFAVVNSLDKQDRQRLQSVLSYDEDSAGGLMNTDTITVRPDVALEVVQRYLRMQHKKIPANTDKIIVVDQADRYVGLLNITDLITHDPSQSVSEVLVTSQDGIPANLPAAQVAHLFEDRDLLSAPVIDENGKLLGRITIDDVVDVIRDEADHSIMRMAGLDEEDDMFAPVVVSTKRRAVWLGVNLVTALLASLVISFFDTALKAKYQLAILMPIVASMGGIAGSQTLTLAIRGIALGHIGSSNAKSLLVKEITIGALNGVLWALAVGGLSSWWFDPVTGAVIAGAIIINLLIAALSGITIPLALKKLNIDPALAGGVILTTVTDVIGFLAFLGLATIILL
ncbi:MAG: magnesium transporter [Gammaproteobacteria bacterium]|nr:MAG: magnesium transporter [Gammaproteobacteria bacterium]